LLGGGRQSARALGGGGRMTAAAEDAAVLVPVTQIQIGRHMVPRGTSALTPSAGSAHLLSPSGARVVAPTAACAPEPSAAGTLQPVGAGALQPTAAASALQAVAASARQRSAPSAGEEPSAASALARKAASAREPSAAIVPQGAPSVQRPGAGPTLPAQSTPLAISIARPAIAAQEEGGAPYHTVPCHAISMGDTRGARGDPGGQTARGMEAAAREAEGQQEVRTVGGVAARVHVFEPSTRFDPRALSQLAYQANQHGCRCAARPSFAGAHTPDGTQLMPARLHAAERDTAHTSWQVARARSGGPAGGLPML
jgi:hypothetical protein